MFLITALTAVIILIGLGFPYAKLICQNNVESICTAPIASVFLIVLFSELYALSGIRASFFSLFFPIIMLGLALCVAKNAVSKRTGTAPSRPDSPVPARPFALSLFLAILLITVLFIKNLDGPDSILQEIDNVFHLGLMKAFAASGDYSSFGTSIYADTAISVEEHVPATFYPSAWHAIGAMLIDLLDVSAPLAANALNSALSAVVYPCTMYVFLTKLFQNDEKKLYAGALVTEAFAVFPWGFLVFGPLYPNLLSFCLLPASASFFISFLEENNTKLTRIKNGIAFVLSLASLVFSQTNAVFTLAVLLAPFCIHQVSRLAKLLPMYKTRPKTCKATLAAFAFLLIACTWYVCYRLPFVQNQVSFTWSATMSTSEAVARALLLSITNKTNPQPLLALSVFIGIMYTLCRRSRLWVSISYIFSVFICILSVSTEGFLKQMLGGFWYTDPFRLAAMAGIIGVPLAALGLYSIYVALAAIMRRVNDSSRFLELKPIIPSLCCLMLAINYFPSFSTGSGSRVDTAFGFIAETVYNQNKQTSTNVLNDEERAFAEKALALVPKGSLIINQPNDGSCFLYTTSNANLYYRNLSAPSSNNETTESEIIRTSLNEIEDNLDVKKAVENIGARYVLILDLGGENRNDRRYLRRYHPEDWTGINAINDETPGFTILLAEGDMRLYEIKR